MIVRGAFNHLLRPGLRKDFRDSYDQYPEEFANFLKSGSQDRAEVEATQIAGLPRMPSRGEAEPIAYLDPVMGARVVYVDTEYALGFQISKRMVEDDQYGKAKQNAKWLARSVRLTQEYLAASLLDDAFAGAIFTGVNAEPLISTSHTLLNSAATGSNRLATDVQLSVTGLQAAYDIAELTVDETGDPIVVRPNKLVVNVADQPTAMALFDSTLEPFTTDNQVNTLGKRAAGKPSVVTSHYKTQGNDWFLIDESLSDAHFLFRVRPQFDDEMDKGGTLLASFYARQRINVFFYDWRGWIGSSP
jgi:hypothetical protein